MASRYIKIEKDMNMMSASVGNGIRFKANKEGTSTVVYMVIPKDKMQWKVILEKRLKAFVRETCRLRKLGGALATPANCYTFAYRAIAA